MSKQFTHAPKAGGGYEIMFGNNVIDSADTLKEARNKIAKFKREMKFSNLVNKYFNYSDNLKKK
ncbi:hypothetical protein FDG95_gp391 [Pectobacterium phage vB_PcaM_CBB]|uniref:Uncharacterized protein n=1 Tax=Pectobacterium phage vB_PcaM_CBB TaxID=2772511 RepID=A0A1L2CU99_9CAUD|nr:hypothetical protein FDG95_gp035 [Pectobacterium phage vB_PcaM_CBB]YP_009595128.1 hypothetical protein FDG95_gp391 [Pectobacterium phage vB_PcaM_CBB]AMM43600.1 hypothetical protein CBB_35 [Pectobacterium phage vB_PcaM_CBB]AMM44151.1 hypothetical protein CBB_588 [Pectobacterium phage vB_PcaM_CBB]